MVRLLRGLAALAVLLIALTVPAGPAAAHAELIQASPRADSVVGGSVHSVRMQFTGLDPAGPHEARLFGPDGDQIPSQLVKAEEAQRLILPTEPFQVPGDYLVTFTVYGIDGDVSSSSFGFRFDPTAPAAEPLTIELGGSDGFDWVGWLIIMAAAGCLAYLVVRFRTALMEHRAAQSAGGT